MAASLCMNLHIQLSTYDGDTREGVFNKAIDQSSAYLGLVPGENSFDCGLEHRQGSLRAL
jgi:hypothetical protein